MDSDTTQTLIIVADLVLNYKGNKHVFKRIFENDVEVKCEIRDQKLHGKCSILFPEEYRRYAYGYDQERKIICNYHDGLLHGEYQEFQNNILFLSCSYSYGKKEGVYLKNWDIYPYINSPVVCRISCYYSNDMKQGEYKEFYKNGKLSVYCSNYLNDMKHGIYATFCDSGEINTEAEYRNDILHGIRRNHYRGLDFFSEEIYVDGILQNSN